MKTATIDARTKRAVDDWLARGYRVEIRADEYVQEVKRAKADMVWVSTSWYADNLVFTVYFGDEEIKREQYTIGELCEEPAEMWHNGKTIDKHHYNIVSDIAARLEEQAMRLYAVLATLDVEEDGDVESGVETPNQ